VRILPPFYIREEIRNKAVCITELVSPLASFDVDVITLACFVVVSKYTYTINDKRQPILVAVRTPTSRFG
jgi:hypothetical protein